MVSYNKSEYPKSASSNFKPTSVNNVYKKYTIGFLLFIFLVLLVLSATQIWAFFFLYNRLRAIEFHSPENSRQEIRSILKEELDNLLTNKVFQIPNPQNEVKRHSFLPERNIPDHSVNLFKDYRDDRPHGPPLKSYNLDSWFINDHATLDRNKRSIHRKHHHRNRAQFRRETKDEGADLSSFQLPSVSTISYKELESLCNRTRASCVGPKGDKGYKGQKGYPGLKGDTGLIGIPGGMGIPGEKGQKGGRGIKGSRGPRGPTGPKGMNGRDGRDGLPGEPGLDGVPGRNGFDGIDGVCEPGDDGRPGRDGRNGTDGRPGEQGQKGHKGIPGQRGLTGPRGFPGKDGEKGIRGEPGVTAYDVKDGRNGSLLIAPGFPDTRDRIFTVREGSHMRLSCKASGFPVPLIEWTRTDDLAITTGYWKDGTVEGNFLNLSYIGREHTGIYKCEAYNGIPPTAYRKFEIRVHFDPFIRVTQRKVGADLGDNVNLTCFIEAFPQAVTYWEDRNGRILENGIEIEGTHRWKTRMIFNITKVTEKDFGYYYCVAKNELSITKGYVRLYKKDPTRHTFSTGKIEGMVFGTGPPNYAEIFNETCDTSRCCKQESRVGSSNLRYCIDVERTGQVAHKKTRCALTAVGKPVYQTKSDSEKGSWMRESFIKGDSRYWRTISTEPEKLYEFKNKDSFRNNKGGKIYHLKTGFQGNSHVIYNGYFFYHSQKEKKIIRYNLTSKTENGSVSIPRLEMKKFLYQPSTNYLDLNVDDNGLWVIYGVEGNKNTVVMKINDKIMKDEYTLTIKSLDHQEFGEMFIICGILYGVKSASEKDTKITLAYDLFKQAVVDIDLPFTNPVSTSTVISYNPVSQKLYSWAGGTQLEYPVKTLEE